MDAGENGVGWCESQHAHIQVLPTTYFHGYKGLTTCLLHVDVSQDVGRI
jgi:hypothetical protein